MINTKSVGFVDIPAQYKDVQDQIIESIKRLMNTSSFVGGAVLEEFEKNLAKFSGVKHAVGCSDGTMALVIALLASGLEPGDRVIVPANSYIASANAVVHAGGRPVLLDCDAESYLLDLNQLEDSLVKDNVKFVMPVHLYGNPCQMDRIVTLAEQHGAVVIEDNAQALGAKYKDTRTGGFGKAAGVSFYPAKNLGAFGQGGALLTNDSDVAELALIYREQGQGKRRYYHDVVGFNARLDTLQAAVLNILLEKLDDFNAKRNEAAAVYRKLLPDDRLQQVTPHSYHTYHLFEFKCGSSEERSKLVDTLKEKNIGHGFHYPKPIHKQAAYKNFNSLNLPVCESLAETLVSLPMHPGLEKSEIDYVCDAVMSCM